VGSVICGLLHNGGLHDLYSSDYVRLDLNISSQDLNQPVASETELPKERSGTGQTEITSNNGNPQLDSNRQRALCQDPLPEEQMIC
jgi:hypothetical protein